MLAWLRSNVGLRRNGRQLYGRIVAQARSVALYQHCGVPDTMDGRLEMVLLHVVLVLERLKYEGAAGQRLGQRLMEEMIRDMDDVLRRLGYGDDSVSGRIPKLAAAMAERARDYRPDGPLEAALLEHVLRVAVDAPPQHHHDNARRLASYVRRSRETLAQTQLRDLHTGEAAFAPVVPDAGGDLAEQLP